MSTFDVSRMAHCRHCLGSLVTRMDHTGSYFVHTGTWSIRCATKQATGEKADPMVLTQADVQLIGEA